MLETTQRTTTTGPRSGGSRCFASPPCAWHRAPRSHDTRPAHRTASRKLASGFLRSAPTPRARKVAAQAADERPACTIFSYQTASGYTVGPNSGEAALFGPYKNTAVPCIECHGVSAQGFSGNVNGFRGLTTLSGVSPENAAAYQNFADGLQTYGPPTLAVAGAATIVVPATYVVGTSLAAGLAAGGSTTTATSGAVFVVSRAGSGLAGAVTVEQGAAATGALALRAVAWGTPVAVGAAASTLNNLATNPPGSRVTPWTNMLNTAQSGWNWVVDRVTNGNQPPRNSPPGGG